MKNLANITIAISFLVFFACDRNDSTNSELAEDVAELSNSEITLAVLPPIIAYDWSSPSKLVGSVTANEARTYLGYTHPRGHVFVEVKCDGDRESMATAIIGDGAESEKDLLLTHQVGLGVLFHKFSARFYGSAEAKAEIKARVDAQRWAPGYIGFIKYKVKDEACALAKAYLEEYKKADPLYQGLSLDPMKGEGAASSSLAVSTLRVAGINDPAFASWMRSVNIPNSIIGNKASGKKIAVESIKARTQWAKAGEAFTPISFYDPGLMHDFIEKKSAFLAANPRSADHKIYKSFKILKSFGLERDATGFPLPSAQITGLISKD